MHRQKIEIKNINQWLRYRQTKIEKFNDNNMGESIDPYEIQKSILKENQNIYAWKLGCSNRFSSKAFNSYEPFVGAILSEHLLTLKGESEIKIPTRDIYAEIELSVKMIFKDEANNELKYDNLWFKDIYPSVEIPMSKYLFPKEGLNRIIQDCGGAGLLLLGQPLKFSDFKSLNKDFCCKFSFAGEDSEKGTLSNLNFDIEETFCNFIECAKQNTLPIKEGQFVALGGLTKCVEIPFNTRILVNLTGFKTMSFILRNTINE